MTRVETMRAARVGSDGTLHVEDVECPTPGAQEVRLRVEACGICGSDLHACRSGQWPAGLIPGHEIAGRIERLGSAAIRDATGSTLREGQRVVVEPLHSCGECPECRAGRDSICPALRIAGVHLPGGFADKHVAPAHRIYSVPDSLDAELAALVEPYAVALHALDRGAPVAGQRVLVIGAGPIGLLSLLAARRAGAAHVAVRARHAPQAELAKRWGAEEEMKKASLQPPGVDSGAYDLVIETVGGDADTLIEAGEAAKPNGIIVVLGLFSSSPRIDPALLLRKELSLHWSNCYHRGREHPTDFARALEAVAEESERLRDLVSSTVPLDRITQGFEQATRKAEGFSKVIVTPRALSSGADSHIEEESNDG